jgi:hypothetical protein
VQAEHIREDVDQLNAANYPRKAAKLAAKCRERGDRPHAEKLHAPLAARRRKTAADRDGYIKACEEFGVAGQDLRFVGEPALSQEGLLMSSQSLRDDPPMITVGCLSADRAAIGHHPAPLR